MTLRGYAVPTHHRRHRWVVGAALERLAHGAHLYRAPTYGELEAELAALEQALAADAQTLPAAVRISSIKR